MARVPLQPDHIAPPHHGSFFHANLPIQGFDPIAFRSHAHHQAWWVFVKQACQQTCSRPPCCSLLLAGFPSSYWRQSLKQTSLCLLFSSYPGRLSQAASSGCVLLCFLSAAPLRRRQQKKKTQPPTTMSPPPAYSFGFTVCWHHVAGLAWDRMFGMFFFHLERDSVNPSKTKQNKLQHFYNTVSLEIKLVFPCQLISDWHSHCCIPNSLIIKDFQN